MKRYLDAKAPPVPGPKAPPRLPMSHLAMDAGRTTDWTQHGDSLKTKDGGGSLQWKRLCSSPRHAHDDDETHYS